MKSIDIIAHTFFRFFEFQFIEHTYSHIVPTQVLQKGAGDAVLSRFIRYFGSDLLVSIEDHGGMLEDNIGKLYLL